MKLGASQLVRMFNMTPQSLFSRAMLALDLHILNTGFSV